MIKTCLSLLTAALLSSAALAGPLDTARFTDRTGRAASLAPYRGKVTVVNFWATWCTPCREEMPMMQSLRDRFAGRGLEVVGIALDNPAEVKTFLRLFHIRYPVLMGDADTLETRKALGNPAGGLPYTLILDRSGKPVGKLLGKLSEKTLTQAVEPLL